MIAERLAVYLQCDMWIETLTGESPSQLGDRMIRAFSLWQTYQGQRRPTPRWLSPPLYLVKQSHRAEVSQEESSIEELGKSREFTEITRLKDPEVPQKSEVSKDLESSEETKDLERREDHDRVEDFEDIEGLDGSEALDGADDSDELRYFEVLEDLVESQGGEKSQDQDLLLPELDLLRGSDFYEEFDDPQISDFLQDLEPSQAQDLLEIIDQYAEELSIIESRDDLTQPVRAVTPLFDDEHSLWVTGYQVHFTRDAEADLIDFIEDAINTEALDALPTVVVISDDNVGKLYSGSLVGTLQKRGLNAHLVTFPAGERSKSLRVLEALTTRLLKLGVNRRDWLIALGGGVTGDLCGLLAALYMRGLKWAQVPTSLLAQVDSSVGAKTAVNHPLGKNLIGAFYRPEWVWIDEAYLRTLPPRQLRAGWVEAIKHGLIVDRELFDLLSRLGSTLHSHERDQGQWGTLLRRSVSVKAQIVERDEREQNRRMLLNLGHTLGHAFEACHDDLLHGEAVALGICATIDYALHYGELSPQDAQRIKDTFSSAGLSIHWRILITDQIWRRVALDKKHALHQLNFITLDSIGSARCETLTLQEFEDRINKII
jgi:3-dehydroquinate synthase